jgi:hypothetical protein
MVLKGAAVAEGHVSVWNGRYDLKLYLFQGFAQRPVLQWGAQQD